MRQVWQFEDSCGITRTGYFERFTDYGGTDVTYAFRDTTNNSLHLVSGERLRKAQNITAKFYADNA